MLTLGMFPTKRDGFTLVELLVVLLLASLSLTVLLPALTTDPVSNSERLENFSSRILMFSSQVRNRQTPITIDEGNQDVLADALNVSDSQLSIRVPIQLNAAGACLSGEFSFQASDVNLVFAINGPTCELVVNNES